MSMFTWFSKKSDTSAQADAQGSDLGHMDATVPGHSSARDRNAPPTQPGSAANRKGERLERRELLYGVVRETMTGAGVLSASYKFKVLSLDSRGVQYLIMMDLAREHASDADKLAEIESHIAQNAKARFGILVTSVYWRVSEQVSGRPTHAPSAHTTTSTPAPAHEPLQQAEITAFKQALAAAPAPQTLSAPGEIVHSGRRHPGPHVESGQGDGAHASPLSSSQYGDVG